MRFALFLATGLLMSLATLAQDAGDPITPAMERTAAELIDAALADNRAYELVESLTTEVGPRLAGTEAEARARAWAVRTFRQLGFSNVRVEPFQVPLWVRGIETAEILAPYPQPLAVSALGGSAATPPAGVSGQLAYFTSLADLRDAVDGAVRGKIVFVDEPMTRTQDGSGYGVAAAKRRETALEAQRLGASAALIRSVGTTQHRFPHTGQMRRIDYEQDAGVPTAALSAPDADQLRRILRAGKSITLRLVITPQILPPAESGNVIAEIPGVEAAHEIILIGAHLDSWDLGTGAADDGAGVGITLAAGKLLLDHLPHLPRRTIRFVLFGAEEVGLVGAEAYARQHSAELPRHIVGTESDFGAGRIWRFQSGVAEEKIPVAQAVGEQLRSLGIGPGDNRASGGPDMHYLKKAGVPVVGLNQDGWNYFDVHHTADDTLDKIDPAALDQNVAAYAAFIYLASAIEGDFR